VNFKKKSKGLLLKQIREAGEKSFEINGRNVNSLGLYLEELVGEGKLEKVSVSGLIYTYRTPDNSRLANR